MELANLYQALISEGFSWDNQTFARVKIENDMVKIWVIFNSIDIWDRLDNKAQLKEWLDKRLDLAWIRFHSQVYLD